MRTNIEIDDALMNEAMKAGPFNTKKDAVEAGLRLLARQAAYREVLKWEGKLHWEGDESIDWTLPAPAPAPEPAPGRAARRALAAEPRPAPNPPAAKRRARR
jgi:Arc/MetJ family transcription regulator